MTCLNHTFAPSSSLFSGYFLRNAFCGKYAGGRGSGFVQLRKLRVLRHVSVRVPGGFGGGREHPGSQVRPGPHTTLFFLGRPV